MKNWKEWQKLLWGIVVMFILLVAVDRMVGYFFDQAYKQSKYGIYHRQEYCLHESKEEILILGSSRAAHHYVPQIFVDSLGMSCYNCGSDGQCIYYSYGLLSAYIERGAIPKIVIYEVMPTDIEVSEGATFTLDAAVDRLLPNYGEYEQIDSLIELKGWKEKVKLLSKTYRYNSKLVQLIKCNFIGVTEDRGYEPLFGVMDDKLTAESSKKEERSIAIEEGKVDCLKKMMHLCKDNNIQLVLAYSPYYKTYADVKMIKEIAQDESVLFWDMARDTYFDNSTLFRDGMHLNDEGAKAYTRRIIGMLNH